MPCRAQCSVRCSRRRTFSYRERRQEERGRVDRANGENGTEWTEGRAKEEGGRLERELTANGSEKVFRYDRNLRTRTAAGVQTSQTTERPRRLLALDFLSSWTWMPVLHTPPLHTLPIQRPDFFYSPGLTSTSPLEALHSRGKRTELPAIYGNDGRMGLTLKSNVQPSPAVLMVIGTTTPPARACLWRVYSTGSFVIVIARPGKLRTWKRSEVRQDESKLIKDVRSIHSPAQAPRLPAYSTTWKPSPLRLSQLNSIFLV